MKKSNLYLIGIFAVLLVITILVLNKQGGNYSTDEISEKFVTFDSAQVDKIEVYSKGQTIKLEKNAGEWHITSPINYIADQELIKRMISSTKSGKLTTSVSSNPEKQNLYQVDSTGTKVTYYEKGKKKDAFIVGKTGSDYTSTFIRKENSKNVFLVDKSLSYDYGKALKEWRDKSIYKAPVSVINEIKFVYGDTVFSLKKMQNSWFIDSDSVQLGKIETFLSSISNMNADDFLDSSIVFTGKPVVKFTISTSYSEEIRIYKHDGNQTNYYVQSSKSPQIFVMESYFVNNLLKRKRDFLK